MWILGIFDTLRGSLVFSFSIFLALLATVIGANVWLDQKVGHLDAIVSTLAEVDNGLQEANALENMFFSHETIDPKFYISGRSEFIQQRKTAIGRALQGLTRLQAQEQASVMQGQETVQEALELLRSREAKFDTLVALVLKRGFKDWGVEGEMRRAIHHLEERWVGDDMTPLLMARRHEKDFIIRKDTRYEKLLQAQIVVLRAYIQQHAPPTARPGLDTLVQQYARSFARLAVLERRIGFDIQDDDGLRYRLLGLSQRLKSNIAKLNAQTLAETHRVRSRTKWASFAVMGACLLSGAVLAVFMAKALGKPIRDLSASIHYVIQQEFDPSASVLQIHGRNEIASLSRDVSQMLARVHDSMDRVTKQAKKLERQQSQLLDSLRYAERIQAAILPSPEDFGRFFPQHFAIYLPKHLVSGDFYWMGKRKGRLYLAVADCTGHGVPGAFMSMIGATLLHKIIMQDKILETNAILEMLDQEIVEALRQDREGGERNSDGLDIALCCLEESPDGAGFQLQFSGAKQSLLYAMPQAPLAMLKGDKRSIGGKLRPERPNTPFAVQEAWLPKGTALYLSTDGFPDQHNEAGEKMGKKRFHAYLQECAALPHFGEQQAFVLQQLSAHQGAQEQRDDMTLLAVQL